MIQKTSMRLDEYQHGSKQRTSTFCCVGGRRSSSLDCVSDERFGASACKMGYELTGRQNPTTRVLVLMSFVRLPGMPAHAPSQVSSEP